MNRREFLRRTLSVGAGATALGALSRPASASPGLATSPNFASIAAAKNWTDPSAWSTGSVPGPNDVATVSGPVVLTSSVSVAGIQIVEGGELYLDPATSVTIETTGNIVVRGVFSLRPSPSAVHRVRFVGVNEGAFVGGGHDVLESDVGLWVVENGILDAVGTPKVAWNRTGNDATWSSSDQLIVTPTAAGDYDGFRAFTKGSAVPRALGQFPAEVLNLTRNVVIEGTEGGRAHLVFLHALQRQTVQYVEIRHMGPRRGPAGDSDGVVGRYPLHFHHCGGRSRGSLIEGVVVHRSGNRAFVPHGSHGITLRNCVAYDVKEDAFWWDLPEGGSDANNSHDSVWDSCVAALIKPEPSFRGFELAGFVLGHGNNNVCVNSVAVGIQGNKAAAGFRWPQRGNSFRGIWRFKDNVSHNNKRNGLGVWQNNTTGHVVEDTLIYHMGFAAITHGAYVNEYHYRNITAYDCEHVVDLHAVGDDLPMLFTNVIGIDIRSEDVLINAHNLPGIGASFFGGSLTSLKLDDNPKGKPDANPGVYDFVDTGITTNDVTLASMANGSLVRIQTGGSAWRIDSDGAVTSIPRFWDGDTTAPTSTTTTSAPATTTTSAPTTTTTQPAPTPTTTEPTTTTTTAAAPGNSGGNRQRRRRRRPAGPNSAPSTEVSTALTSEAADTAVLYPSTSPSAATPVAPSPAAQGSPPVQNSIVPEAPYTTIEGRSVTPPALDIAGSASAHSSVSAPGSASALRPASDKPIAKQLVSRPVPVSLNVPAALGPAQPSPTDPTTSIIVATPQGVALTAVAAAAVVLYRRRIATTEIPDSIQAYRATSVGDAVRPIEEDPRS